MITACSSRTSCIISAEAGTTCSVAGCDAVAWLSWYWAMMTPPSTLTKVAGRTSITSLPTNRLSMGASCFGAKFFGAKFFGAKFFGAKFFGAKFFGAKFFGAKFFGAKFFGAKFFGAKFFG